MTRAVAVGAASQCYWVEYVLLKCKLMLFKCELMLLKCESANIVVGYLKIIETKYEYFNTLSKLFVGCKNPFY